MHKVIAKIESTDLGYEDHGILTFWLHVLYGGSGQGIGGYMFSGKPKGATEVIGAPGGMTWIMRILDACGVNSWEKLKGRTIFAIKESDDWNAKVIGIGPLPTEKGKDFMFDEIELWSLE